MAKRIEPHQLAESNFATAPGFRLDLIEQAATGTYTTTAGAFEDINAEFEKTVTIPISGLYDITFTVSVEFTSGSSDLTACLFRLLFDGTDAVAESGTTWEVSGVAGSGTRVYKTMHSVVELTSGQHTVKPQWYRNFATSTGLPTIQSGQSLYAVGKFLSGSGLGGVAATHDAYGAGPYTGGSGFQAIMSKVVSVGQGEILIAKTTLSFEPASSSTCSFRLKIDDTIVDQGNVGWAGSGTDYRQFVHLAGHLEIATSDDITILVEIDSAANLTFHSTEYIQTYIYRGGQHEIRDGYGTTIASTARYLQFTGARDAGDGGVVIVPDTKSPKGTWQTGTTVNFAARPGQSSTVYLTLQDGKQRSFSGTLNWSDANGVTDLGYDETSSQTGTDKLMYFYAVPSTGDDTVLSIRASDNPPTTGPTGYSNWKLVWATYENTNALTQVYQSNNVFTYPERTMAQHNIGAGDDAGVPQSLSLTYIPESAGVVRGSFYAIAGTLIVYADGHTSERIAFAAAVASGELTWSEYSVPVSQCSGARVLYYEREDSPTIAVVQTLIWEDEWIDP